jgi:hypothetical protein
VREVKEVAAGAQFSRSSENGRVADSGTRAFKILMDYPGEVIDLQQTCNVYIGSPHPFNPQIFCTSFDARFDGESRMVILCTFQYASAASSDSTQDNREKAPDIRPANYTTGTAVFELPARSWKPIENDTATEDGTPGSERVSAKNPAGDFYDGVNYMAYMMTVSVEQYVPDDPTLHMEYVGKVNSDELSLGTLIIKPRTLMLRGITMRPTVESWGDRVYRGWVAAYEFAYRNNTWDMRIPQTGFNVKAFLPANAGQERDVYGQPLKHISGKIATPLALPDGIQDGEKVRAMVKVFDYESGGTSQLPSAQPIALNDDGTPRLPSLDPIVKRFCPYDLIDMKSTLALRLF